MLRAALVLCVLSACHLTTPFELRPSSPVDGVGDVDADGDADAEEHVDGDSPSDADAEGDGWDDLRGCLGEVDVEERWLVLAPSGGDARSYLTERDCEAPVLLSAEWAATAISPDGRRALASRRHVQWTPLEQLALIDLVDPAHPVELLEARGANANWVDDHSFVYVAAPEGVESFCSTLGSQELTDLRIHLPDSGEDRLLVGNRPPGWWTCCPAYDEDRGLALFPSDMSDDCEERHIGINGWDVESLDPAPIDWTFRGDQEFLFGLLPDGSGLLIQQAVDLGGPSRLYVAPWKGIARRIYADETLAGVGFGFVPFPEAVEPAAWGHCLTVRRLGPRCELYCRASVDVDDGWLRMTTAGDPPEHVQCRVEGTAATIMDVWQRSIE